MINTNISSPDDDHQNRTPQASNDKGVLAIIMHYLLVQYNLQQGLKIFGERREAATMKELKQILDMDSLIPLNA